MYKILIVSVLAAILFFLAWQEVNASYYWLTAHKLSQWLTQTRNRYGAENFDNAPVLIDVDGQRYDCVPVIISDHDEYKIVLMAQPKKQEQEDNEE